MTLAMPKQFALFDHPITHLLLQHLVHTLI